MFKAYKWLYPLKLHKNERGDHYCPHFTDVERRLAQGSTHIKWQSQDLRSRWVQVAQPCPTLSTPGTVQLNSPGQNTGVGSLSLLQGIFPTQESNQGLWALQADPLPTEPSGKLWDHGSEPLFRAMVFTYMHLVCVWALCTYTHNEVILGGKKEICFPPSFLAHDLFSVQVDVHTASRRMVKGKEGSHFRLQTSKLILFF